MLKSFYKIDSSKIGFYWIVLSTIIIFLLVLFPLGNAAASTLTDNSNSVGNISPVQEALSSTGSGNEKINFSAKGHNMTFGTTIDSASYRFPASYLGPIDLNASIKEIDLAKELGVNYVRFDIRIETLLYQKEIKKLDTLINYSRSKNLKVYLGVYGMETWLPSIKDIIVNYPEGGGGKAKWEYFKTNYTWEANYLAKKYKPDYMMIMVECPYNIGNQVNSKRSTEEWSAYTKKVANSIKKISPNTKIILGLTLRVKSSPTSIYFADTIMKENDPNIDIIGIHPYSYEEFNDEVLCARWLKYQYGWHGDIWIDEANTFPYVNEEYQKAYFEYILPFAIENPDLKGFCIFRLRDISNDIGGNYGIVNHNFTKKAAYSSIKQILNLYSQT